LVSSHGHRTAKARLLLVAAATAAACNAIVGIDEPVIVEPKAEHCILNSDCSNEHEICLFETCSPPCEEDLDCVRGQFCLSTADGNGCVSPTVASCGNQEACPPGTACFEGQCRTDCRTNQTACLQGQTCDGDGACRGSAGTGGTGGTSGGGTGGTGPSGGTGASGGGGEGGEATGTGGTGGTGTVGDPCSDEGAEKCARSASTGRLLCEDGAWVATSPCDAGELCDSSSDPPGQCEVVPEECRGRTPGAGFCEGTTRVVCGPDLVTVERRECASLQHCSLATGPECAVCLPNDYRCTDDTLERCSDELTGWGEVETCMNEPCNADAGACTSYACANPGDRRCMNDRLEECNADRSGFDLVDLCDQGLCDPVALECDRCVAGSKGCANGTTRRLCSDDGQMQTEPSCPTDSEHCTGAGVCVECTGNGDCQPMNSCYVAACNTGTGRCEDTFRGANVDCAGGGHCTAAGACVQCTLPEHCTTTTPCTTATCRSNNTCGTDPFDFSRDVDNCGACGTMCSSSHVSTRTCSSSTCQPSCQSGWATCNAASVNDGCETNVATDPNNCGSCGRNCSTNHVTNRTCSGNNCSATCVSPWLNCDSDYFTNGCENRRLEQRFELRRLWDDLSLRVLLGPDVRPSRAAARYGPGPSSENRGANALQGFQITISAATTVEGSRVSARAPSRARRTFELLFTPIAVELSAGARRPKR
jgi:hypothetical protein